VAAASKKVASPILPTDEGCLPRCSEAPIKGVTEVRLDCSEPILEYQLKAGHAAVGTYLRRIGAQEPEVCRWCAAPKESVYHPLFECRPWRSQRAAMYRTFEKDKVPKLMPREEEPEARIFENRTT
jgi:hypothetical protein